METKIVEEVPELPRVRRKEKPKKVAIVALGLSHVDYTQGVMKLGGNCHALADEIWAINKMAGVIRHDVMFRMDDFRKSFAVNQTEVQTWQGKKKTEDMWYDFLRKHPGPIITSKRYPEWPNTVEYPLEDVINELGAAYFNSTPAYAVAYAIYLGVEQLNLYGLDFSYPNRHSAETGRACIEFWLQIARGRGIELFIGRNSSLLDTNVPVRQKFYGYKGTVEVKPHPSIEGKIRVVERTDFDKEVQTEQEKRERSALDQLMKKYKPDLLDAPLATGAPQDEALKGDSQCQAHNDTPKVSPMPNQAIPLVN